MQVISNEKWLAAVSGGEAESMPVDSAEGGGSTGGSGATNMSHASAGTDSSYYGAAATSTQVAAAVASQATNPCGVTVTQTAGSTTVSISLFPPNVTYTLNPTINTISTVCPPGGRLR
jgi:hypothetical protein